MVVARMTTAASCTDDMFGCRNDMSIAPDGISQRAACEFVQEVVAEVIDAGHHRPGPGCAHHQPRRWLATATTSSTSQPTRFCSPTRPRQPSSTPGPTPPSTAHSCAATSSTTRLESARTTRPTCFPGSPTGSPRTRRHSKPAKAPRSLLRSTSSRSGRARARHSCADATTSAPAPTAATATRARLT